MKKETLQPLIVFILGFVGLWAAGYLVLNQLQGTEITNCPIFEGGCSDVLKSQYSEFMGVPLSYYGVIFYSGMIVVSGLFLALRKKIIKELLALGTLIGFIDSVIFVYIQAALIGSFCFYCLVSATTATLMFFVMLPTIIYKLLEWYE
jgi:uncharacterized membrane protein